MLITFLLLLIAQGTVLCAFLFIGFLAVVHSNVLIESF